jgi:hypothetical protein
MSKHPSKSHVPAPEDGLHPDGSVNLAAFEADSAKAFEAFKSGKETLLDAKRMVCHDGSVWDCFHHIATDALHGATKHASE